MLIGDDKIKGRIKLAQGIYDFEFRGLVMITANQMLSIDDSLGAIERIIAIFTTCNVLPPERQEIMLVTNGKVN